MSDEFDVDGNVNVPVLYLIGDSGKVYPIGLCELDGFIAPERGIISIEPTTTDKE